MDCIFPFNNGWNKTVFDYHCYSIILSLPFALCFLADSKLRRFYFPLAFCATAASILQLGESIIYLLHLPENFESMDVENCGEIVLSRLFAMATIFAEMHVVYFLSKALGLGGQNISLGRGVNLNLSQGLVLILLASIVSFIACIFYRRSFGVVRNIWCIGLALLQYQQIRTAKSKNDHDNCLIRPNDVIVSLFEKLTFIQIFISLVCLLQRGVYKPMFPHGIVRLNNSRLVLDFATVLLFYLKVLVVQEKSNVEVEVTAADA